MKTVVPSGFPFCGIALGKDFSCIEMGQPPLGRNHHVQAGACHRETALEYG